MVRRKLPPIVALALGTAFSLYGIPFAVSLGSASQDRLAPWTAVVSVIAGGAALTLAERRSALLVTADRDRTFRAAAGVGMAFALGIALGLAAAGRSDGVPSLGLPRESITSISTRLADDPRRLENGSVLLSTALISCGDAEGRKASSSGSLLVILSEDASSSVFAQGKGATVEFKGSVREGRLGLFFRSGKARIMEAPSPIERKRNSALAFILKRFRTVGWGGLAAALLLGNKDGLEEGERELYASAGCAHVLSLSGMHLAVISALIALALKRPLGVRAAAVAGTFAVVSYLLFIGFRPALVRSVLMYALGAFAILAGYRRRMMPLLSAAFLIQVLLDAEAARGLSFVLSYLALIGITVLGDSVHDLLRGWLPRSLLLPMSASIGAFLATAAVSAAAFGSLHPVGILASIIVAPAAIAVMLSAIAWLAVDIVVPPLAAALSPLVGLAAAASEKTVHLAGAVPALEFPSFAGPLFASLATASLLVYGRYRMNEMRNRIDPFD